MSVAALEPGEAGGGGRVRYEDVTQMSMSEIISSSPSCGVVGAPLGWVPLVLGGTGGLRAARAGWDLRSAERRSRLAPTEEW